MEIKEVMRQAYIIEKDISLSDAAKIMSSKELSSLLFVKSGKIRGIITERDLLKNFNKSKTISQIMTKKVITISPGEEVEKALELMKANKVKKIPVVDEKNKLIGIINLTDIVANTEGLEGDFFFN
jgi:IMP dehydrogenase